MTTKIKAISENAFPNVVRLRKRTEFLRLTNAQNKFAGRGILVVWIQNNANIETARIGITVSKKIGCAVKRNRIKRVIRDIFRRNRTKLIAADINVIARSASASMNYDDLNLELTKAFQRINHII